jgi:type IV pilus assembly protein PilM
MARPSFFSINTHLRPALACEITLDGVFAARRSAPDALTMSYAALRDGVVTPGLKTPNLTDAQAVAQAIRQVLDESGARDKNITVVIPDSSARIFILDFDSLPAREREAKPILRFRLRKLVPFDVEDASISYQIMSQTGGAMRALVVATPSPVLAEYEAAVRLAGYEPGVVLTSTIAALSALNVDEPALVVNRNSGSITTAIANRDELLLHRTLDLPPDTGMHRSEITQAVSVAVAYFEDTLKSLPTSIYYAGPGTASEFAALIDTDDPLAPRVRELVPTPATGAVTSMPRGTSAAVAGALAS